MNTAPYTIHMLYTIETDVIRCLRIKVNKLLHEDEVLCGCKGFWHAESVSLNWISQIS